MEPEGNAYLKWLLYNATDPPPENAIVGGISKNGIPTYIGMVTGLRHKEKRVINYNPVKGDVAPAFEILVYIKGIVHNS